MKTKLDKLDKWQHFKVERASVISKYIDIKKKKKNVILAIVMTSLSKIILKVRDDFNDMKRNHIRHFS